MKSTNLHSEKEPKKSDKTPKSTLIKLDVFTPFAMSILLSITVFAGSVTFFLIEKVPSGYVKTLVPTIGDEELYLSIFNTTSLARVIVNPILSKLFGYHSADALLAIWSMVISGILALGIYLLICQTLKTEKKATPDTLKNMIISSLGTLFFFAYFDEFERMMGALTSFVRYTSIETILEQGLSGYLTSALSNFIDVANVANFGKTGGVIGRFPHPGSYLILFVFGVVATKHLLQKRKAPLWIPIGLSILVIPLVQYPWIGLSFFCYLGLTTVITFFKEKKVHISLIIVAIIMGLFFAKDFLTISSDSPDFLMRVDVVYRRLPKPGFLEANFIVFLCSLLFLRNPLGKLIAKIQAGIILALCSSLFTGYYVQPSHFFYVTAISLSLLSTGVLVILVQKIYFWKPVTTFLSEPHPRRLAFALAFLFLLNVVFWENTHGTRFPSEYAELIEELQTVCAEEITYFFAKDPALWYAIPARTSCRNTIPMSLNRQLSNLDIAETYSAVLKHFGVINTKADLLAFVETRLQYIGTNLRNESKDMYLFSERDRELSQSFFYPYHYASLRDEQIEYFLELFDSVDFGRLLNFWNREYSSYRTIELPY